MRLAPDRGLFLDRNGELIVSNIASYDLLYKAKDAKDIDTTAFAQLLGWEEKKLVKQLEKASGIILKASLQ